MLKKRIIPIQLLLDGRLVKTANFDTWRDVGDPVKSSQVYNSQNADELIFLNIARSGSDIRPMAKLISEVSRVSFMPLAVGGGIRTFDDIEFLIKNGADKVVINTAAYDSPELITQAADAFGTQAVVVSIDAKWNPETGKYRLASDCGRCYRDVYIEKHIRDVESCGAGEILVQSIDRDGTMRGFDIPLIQAAMKAASVPVIGCGGSGNYDDLKDAFMQTDVSALACGSLFNFSDSNPMRAKNFLANYGIPFKKV